MQLDVHNNTENYEDNLASTRRGQKSMILGEGHSSKENIVMETNEGVEEDPLQNLSIDDLIKSNQNSPRTQVYQRKK